MKAVKCHLCGKHHLKGACRNILQGNAMDVAGKDAVYQCREDFVLIKIIPRNSEGGLIYPDISQDGKDHFVINVGPKVEGLKKGDRVMSIAQQGSFVFLPGRKMELYVTRATNIALVLDSKKE